MPTEALQAGDPRTVGPYRLLWRLGRGGMGRVYVGRSRGGRAVAVKVVHPEFAGDPQFRRRFAQEVAAARKVGGFYTAQVVDADPQAETPWLATAYVPGPSLYEAVEAHGPLAGPAVRALGAGLAEALMAVHQAGLVHRDLKPANIILAGDGPRVIDFGISRALDASHASTTVIGTPGFMSPEQARGLEAGPAGDVFALGAVLAFAASGRGPFGTGQVEAIIYRIVHAEPDLEGVPGDIADLARACLAKEPAERPAVAEVLDRLAAPSGASSTATSASSSATATASAAGETWVPAAVTTMIDERERELSAQIRALGTTLDGGGSSGPRTPAGPRDTLAQDAAVDAPSAQTGQEGGPAPRRPPVSRRNALAAAGLGVAAAVGVPLGLVLSSGSRRGSANGDQGRARTASDTASGNLRPQGPVTVFDGGAGLVRSAAFHPGGGHLASAGEDGVVRLFETATWQAARTFTHKVANPWNLSLAKITAFNALFNAAMCVNFRPDGRDLAVANGDGTVSLWNLAQGTEVVLPFIDPTEWNGVVASVAFAPNGGTLAAVYDSAAVRIWRTGDQTTVANLATGAGYWIAQVAYHPAGGLLASASGNGNPGNGVGDGLLELWDPTSGSKITTLADTNSPEGQLLAFSPDGKTLANVRSDGQTTLWDVAAQSARTVLTPAGSGASCVAFGPGGLLATGFTDGTVTVWSARSGKALATLTTRSDSKVHSVAFSPDARYLAATTSRLSVWTLRASALAADCELRWTACTPWASMRTVTDENDRRSCRVRLVELSAGTMSALRDGDLRRAGARAGVELTEFFVTDRARWLWRLRLEQIAADPGHARWMVRQAVVAADGLVVGHAGFHGPPDQAGMVEIGYAIAPAFRRRGYGRAALIELLRRAAAERGVTTVRAAISPDNAASLATIRGFGFVQVGEQWDDEDGLELVFEVPVGGSPRL